MQRLHRSLAAAEQQLHRRRWRLCSSVSRSHPHSINEFRHNLVTDDWVVFSSARRGRPRQVPAPVKSCSLTSLPDHEPSCPFCRGNEKETPPATFTAYYPQGHRAQRGANWRLRVVPNKFPAVTTDRCLRSGVVEETGELNTDLIDGDESRFAVESVPALGFHEVLIETPEHNLPTALMDVAQVQAVVQAMQIRGKAMQAADPTLRHIMYFKNSGTKAGASLLHPHSQIVALPIVPVEVAQRQRHARQWFTRYQKNVFQHTLDTTMRQRDDAKHGGKEGAHRVVLEDDHFVCFIPFAALSPYSLWIVPKGIGAHFHEASEEEVLAFARILRQALRCLHFGLEEPDFNMVIRTAALETGAMSVFRPEVYFRWYCTIIPRLGVGQMGGFEFSTGIQSNSSFPEDDAAFLRFVVEANSEP